VGILVCALWPSVASAQTVDDATRRAARNLGVAGVEAFQARDYATASDKLDKAYRSLRAPSLGLWSARALVNLNKLVEAAERYQEVARLNVSGGDQAIQLQAQSDAAGELEKLAPQIPNLVVKVRGADANGVSVTIDGVALASALVGESRPVNPGKHHVQATSAGQTVDAEAEVAVGETKSVELGFTAAPAVGPPAAPSANASSSDALPAKSKSMQRTLGFVALGVGGAGLVVGGIGSVLAIGKKSSIDDNPNCRDDVCRTSESTLVDSYSTWRTVGSIGLISGVTLAALGAVLIISAPKPAQDVAILVTPRSIALSRKF
jgi:hypothetical protein